MNKIKGLRKQALVVGTYKFGICAKFVPNWLPTPARHCAGEGQIREAGWVFRLKHVAVFLAGHPVFCTESQAMKMLFERGYTVVSAPYYVNSATKRREQANDPRSCAKGGR